MRFITYVEQSYGNNSTKVEEKQPKYTAHEMVYS